MADTTAAVLSGDLIDSRAADGIATARSIETLSGAARDFGKALDCDLRFTRTRGDGWQVLVDRPDRALWVLVYLLARLRAAETGLDTRAALAIDRIDSPGTRDLSDADGPAFHAAGDALAAMTKRRLVIAGSGAGPLDDGTAALLDEVSQRWTAPQAEAVALMLVPDGATQEDVARQIGITRQAVNLRLSGAGYAGVRIALDRFAAAHGGTAR